MAPALIQLVGENDTNRLGGLIADHLSPGHVVALQGDLGAGKSALARALVRALMNEPTLDVPSPSFALVQPYQIGPQQILHADLYRLTESVEIDELGLFDEADAIVIVEWPERAPHMLGSADLHIQLEVVADGEARSANLTSPSGQCDVAGIAAGFAALRSRT